MELNWTTFLLEIINFLLLVWILKHFLYQPVLDIISRRRGAIENQTSDARKLNEEAFRLKKQYEDRLLDWEKERQQARNELKTELDSERARQLLALQTELDRERKKDATMAERLRLEARRESEHRALVQSAAFASCLLEMAVGPELENRLIELLLDELHLLDGERRDALKAELGDGETTVKIASAFQVSVENRKRLQETFATIAGRALSFDFERAPELMAGLLVVVGPWVLRANVRDELKGFAEFAYAAR